MQILTYNQIKALQNTYGQTYVWNNDLNKAGKLCCDCSGLISSYTGILRGSSNYKSTAIKSVSIKTLKFNWKNYIGWGLWLNGHIGVVSDTEGYYYAMDGSARNMVHYPLNKNNWTFCIKLCDIDYSKKVKEDAELVETKQVWINGKLYFCNVILKDGKNYIALSDFKQAGFNIGCDPNSKIPSIGNAVDDMDIIVNGKEKNIDRIMINDTNYCKLRDIVKTLEKNIDYDEIGKITTISD